MRLSSDRDMRAQIELSRVRTRPSVFQSERPPGLERLLRWSLHTRESCLNRLELLSVRRDVEHAQSPGFGARMNFDAPAPVRSGWRGIASQHLDRCVLAARSGEVHD